MVGDFSNITVGGDWIDKHTTQGSCNTFSYRVMNKGETLQISFSAPKGKALQPRISLKDLAFSLEKLFYENKRGGASVRNAGG